MKNINWKSVDVNLFAFILIYSNGNAKKWEKHGYVVCAMCAQQIYTFEIYNIHEESQWHKEKKMKFLYMLYATCAYYTGHTIIVSFYEL